MSHVAMTNARENFPELVNQAQYAKHRTVLTKRGKAIAAIVPLEDLELLEQLENDRDVTEALKRLKKAEKNGYLTHEELLKRLQD